MALANSSLEERCCPLSTLTAVRSPGSLPPCSHHSLRIADSEDRRLPRYRRLRALIASSENV